MIYNSTGNPLFDEKMSDFLGNSSINYLRDSATNTNYYVIRINKSKVDGQKQFPFVYAPNGSGAGTMSTLAMNKRDKWVLAINAGIANPTTLIPHNIIIQNGVVVKNDHLYADALPLTIDGNGDLGYAAQDADANTLVSNGIVSAICGFFPLVVDYDAVQESVYNWLSHYNQSAQRQIIGQFGNGDYCIVSCEGRDYNDSVGWTIAQAISVCQGLGLKFAYNLDGGGSVETVVGEKQVNTTYHSESYIEDTYGRIVSTYICFNGDDTFFVPNQ